MNPELHIFTVEGDKLNGCTQSFGVLLDPNPNPNPNPNPKATLTLTLTLTLISTRDG